jgi:hypothetical protein
MDDPRKPRTHGGAGPTPQAPLPRSRSTEYPAPGVGPVRLISYPVDVAPLSPHPLMYRRRPVLEPVSGSRPGEGPADDS